MTEEMRTTFAQELLDLDLNAINERLAQLDIEVREATEVEEVELSTEKKVMLLERKKELEDLEERSRAAQEIKNGEAKTEIIEERREEKPIMEERKTFGIETAEYRDAFYAMIAGTATAEQRAIVVDTTNPGGGDAIAIPKTLDEKIWDGIHTAHPILADVATIKSGIAMEVTKHTAIATRTTKKLDSASNAGEEENTFVKVVLYGYDYEKYVELTYAEAKMSQGALEDYLAEEIAAELGEALAKDVFAQILADAGATQKVAKATVTDTFDQLKAALALATLANAPVVYAPASRYYDVVGAIKSGSPFNAGAALGVQVKLDNAASDIVVVDPKAFILNVVQDTMIETDRNIKDHKVIVSGYMRAQGTLRKNKAAAYVG